MTRTKSEIGGILGTTLIHLAIVLYLILFGFERNVPTQEVGLVVNFGNVDEAAGLFEPSNYTPPKPRSETPTPAVSASPKKLITQDQESTVSLAEKKKKETSRHDIPNQHLQIKQQQQAKEISNQAAKAFEKASSKNTSQGLESFGSGNQGSQNGNADASGSATKGGDGYGNFSLTGRTLEGALPHPSYTIQEEGIVVIRITVNPQGNVTAASVSLQGTNTDNSTLRNAALLAAKQARFNTIEGTQQQSGTITYRFRLK